MSPARLAGAALVLAAATNWAAWLLMPDAGTADPAHIQAAVRAARDAVRWSVVVQLVSSAAFVPGVLLARPSTRRALAGGCLVLVGATGMAMDAIYHLAAYYLTADGVDPAAALEPLRLMQTDGLRFLVPLLLPYLIGGWVFASGLRREGRASRRPGRVYAAAFAVAGVGGGLAAAGMADRHAVVLGFLGLVSAGYAWTGYDLIRTGEGRAAQPDGGRTG